MISIEIQEWQQMKAKLSQLEQQVLILKSQNEYLKKQLKKNVQDDNQSLISSVDVQIEQFQGQNVTQKQSNSEKQDTNHRQIFNQPYFMQSQSSNNHQSVNSFAKSEQKESVEKQQCDKIEEGSEQDPEAITLSRRHCKQIELKKIISNKKNEENPKRTDLSLIQQICLFGPNLQKLKDVTFKHDDKQFVQPFLYYPKLSQQYQQYGNYVYPSKVRIRPTQNAHISMQGNKIIFKNSKKQDCNIFIFQGLQSHSIKSPNQVLHKVNPSKWLYGIVMEFNDFVFKEDQQEKKIEESVKKPSNLLLLPSQQHRKGGSLLEIDVKQIHQELHRMQSVSLKDIEFQRQKQRMYRGSFSLCIFTYFPFISYHQDLIYAIFDEVKLKRIENFPKSQKFKDCDIFYFINQLNHVISRIKGYFCQNSVKMQRQLSPRINETQLCIKLSEQNLYQQLYGKWAYRMIKKIDRDTMYQIYCMIMLEQSVYFVSEDQKNLTFMILLFSSMLTQPFSYPYPVVSTVFSQELLQTPFTSIIGINQSQKWVDQAISQGLIDFQHKHIIVITQKQVKIRRNFKYNPPKSDKLRKIFTKFYKSMEPSSLSLILLGKQALSSLETTKEGNEHMINFFVKLQLYYHENVFSYMPNKMSISKIGGKIHSNQEQVNKPNVRNKLLQHIQKYYKQANPNYFKDQFLKLFVETEIFSICLMEEYELH